MEIRSCEGPVAGPLISSFARGVSATRKSRPNSTKKWRSSSDRPFSTVDRFPSVDDGKKRRRISFDPVKDSGTAGADCDSDIASQIDHALAEFLRRRLVGQRLFKILSKKVSLLFAALIPSGYKIRLQVNVAVPAEAEGGRVGEDFQVAVCTDVVEQAF